MRASSIRLLDKLNIYTSAGDMDPRHVRENQLMNLPNEWQLFLNVTEEEKVGKCPNRNMRWKHWRLKVHSCHRAGSLPASHPRLDALCPNRAIPTEPPHKCLGACCTSCSLHCPLPVPIHPSPQGSADHLVRDSGQGVESTYTDN